ncbi:MAG: Hsp20/alpha crystallin family protein [Deferrisomatales bacterium]
MALTRWDPRRGELDPLRSLRQEVDRLFDDFFRGWPQAWAGDLPGPAAPAVVAPRIDLVENPQEFVVTAELPGITREGLEVSISEASVAIRGQRETRRDEGAAAYHYRETTCGSFLRVVPLPGAVVPEKARAVLQDGVLTLTLPKADPAPRRVVKVAVD